MEASRGWSRRRTGQAVAGAELARQLWGAQRGYVEVRWRSGYRDGCLLSRFGEVEGGVLGYLGGAASVVVVVFVPVEADVVVDSEVDRDLVGVSGK